ncbi:MAG: ferric reductase-like transmembrane domain-containing protein [Planctomycetes bacterium]|nr:ferric reductase-like transmembrane domain-containing protein [Planctomycetota bacterium]
MTRWMQPALYGAAAITAGIMLITCLRDAAPWVSVRELYGLTALALLLASMIVGPLLAVLTRIPLKGHLLASRRALGVCAFCFALAHVAFYIMPVLSRNWHEIFAPGAWWIVGLSLGAIALACMAPLAWTSRNAAVAAMGGLRWKRLHRLVYVLLPIALLHAVLVGSDFGAHRAPDTKSEPDMGALFFFLGLSAAWLLLVFLRWRRRAATKHG